MLLRECSIAVDIGASSGNVVAGYLEEGKLYLKELHRFPNNLIERNGDFLWDINKLFVEILVGIQKCEIYGLLPKSIGIDTWAVDFVLLDENDQLLTDVFSYRDPRTDGMMDKVFQIITKEELYDRTGIQFQKFNTIYQLYALKEKEPEVLNNAKTFLMLPDYINFLLTGTKANEYTNATTTQLVSAEQKDWDYELINRLGFNKEMFQEIKKPKTYLGNIKEEYQRKFGFDLKVILPATHDTASAIVAVPQLDETIYISSGTWSLIGTENKFPLCTNKALNYNFTNEGGFEYRFRFLKNIMGLWMIQEVKRLYGEKYSYDDLVRLAEEVEDFNSLVDVNDDRFLNPVNMIEEVKDYCKQTKQKTPNTPGQIAKCIYDSLVESYQISVNQIESLLNKKFDKINIIGGGAQNNLLNRLLANKTNKKVYTGPIEATALGNIIVQLIAREKIQDLKEAKNLIKHSFTIEKYV